MLEVVPTTKPGSSGFDLDEGGEELAKRVENFGHPVGKGVFLLLVCCRRPTDPLQDDPDQPPILICKLRKGQALSIRCIAKKVRI